MCPDAPNDALTDEEWQIIDDEQQLFARACAAIEGSAKRARGAGTSLQDLHALRDDASTAHKEDIPSLLAQMRVIHRRMDMQSRGELPDIRVPYFAHMRLRIGDRQRDVLLGYRTFLDAAHRVTIVDWRNAPIARLFFNYRQGDDYEEKLNDRMTQGTIEQRHVVTFDQGELCRVVTPEATLRRTSEGGWVRQELDDVPRLQGGQGGRIAQQLVGTGRTGQRMPVVSALLDRDQYRALNRDDQRPLLILGGAGCGKTTVALHRLASLNFRNPLLYQPGQMGVIVPERGLVRLTRTLLDELDLEQVPVGTLDDWSAYQAREVLKGIPRRICNNTPLAVSRFKRHPAMLASLDALVELRCQEMAKQLDEEVWAGGEIERFFMEVKAKNLLARLNKTERKFKKTQSKARKHRVLSACKRQRRNLYKLRDDRKALWSDQALLAPAVAASEGDLDESDLGKVMAHARLQFNRSTEEAYSDVISERLETVDGRSIDDGTPEEVWGTVDPEDIPLMFQLLWLKTGAVHTRQGAITTYSHLVVDEAQDLAQVELEVLGRTLRKGASVTVAGDAAQQIDAALRFIGWDKVLEALGVGPSSPIHLKTSYRCTRPIAEFAHGVLGPDAPGEPPHAPKDGLPVARSLFANEGQCAVFISEALRDLLRREPRANVAVIARDSESAYRIHRTLAQAMPARLVLEGEFEFRPGVDVTDVSQVKGLEFDYVVIPDASVNHYPTSQRARRLLHVAASRAIHQLWVVAVGKESNVLPAAEN